MIQSALTAPLTDSEIEYLCEIITPRKIKLYFQNNPDPYEKLKPACRAKKLTDQKAISLIVKNRHENFIASFLDASIETYRKDIHDKMASLQETGTTAEVAMIQALADSHIFSKHIELYFKFEEGPVQEGHIALIKAAVSLLCKKEVKGTKENDGQTSDTELADNLALAQRELNKTYEEQARIHKKLLVVQQELDDKQEELSKVTKRMEQMQTELNQFRHREEYADIPLEESTNKEYQYTSLCQVTINSYTGKVQLERLADIDDNHLTPFRINKNISNRFENRKWFYTTDGPTDKVGFFGIWHWNAIPKDNPERDHIDSVFDAWMVPVEISVCSDCIKPEDIINRLLTGIKTENIGVKTLITTLPVNEQYSGLLCSREQFDIRDGIARLKPSVFTLPLFRVYIRNTLALNSRLFFQRLTLDLPLKIVNVKTPLAVVKDIILSKTTVSILQQQGFGVKEARRYLDYLRSLETSTLYDEVAESCGCSIDDAKQYVTEFIERAEKTLNGSDINVDVLSAVIMKNSVLTSECKSMIFKEWAIENEEKLRSAQQMLDEVTKEASEQRRKLTGLESQQDNLQYQIKKLQSEIDEKETLASDVEKNVASRIAEARQNAADFISDFAFMTPIVAQSARSIETGLSIAARPIVAEEISGLIDVPADFENSLAENLERCGYSEERSELLSQILSFCVGQHMPIVCDSNSEIIADCLAAMFGLDGVTVVHISSGASWCGELYDLLHQKEGASSLQVYLINGALDAYSPNVFNGILQDAYNLSNCILIFSSEGTPVEALPPSLWGRAMFIDGDIGLVRLPQGDLNAFEAECDFQQELRPDKLKEKRKQLKPFAQIISNRALLIYSCFMVATDSTIQSDACILTQILLAAKTIGKLENLLELFEENGIDIDKVGLSKYL